MSNDLNVTEPAHLTPVLDVLGGALAGLGVARRMLAVGAFDSDLLDAGLAGIEDQVQLAIEFITPHYDDDSAAIRVPVTDHQAGRLAYLGHDPLTVDGDALVFTRADARGFVRHIDYLHVVAGIAPVEGYVADVLRAELAEGGA